MTTGFAILASLMALAALSSFVLPLWRRPAGADAERDPPQRRLTAGLAVGLLAFTGALYAWVGTPRALVAVAPEAANAHPAAAGGMSQQQIEAMVARLAARLQSQPDDPAGWRRLARSYETLGRFAQAVQAYQQLLQRQPPDADLLTDYAVTLGMASGQTLTGEPEALIDAALRLAPDHAQALALSGRAAFERRDYLRAIAQWQRLQALAAADDDTRASIERQIAQAQSLAQQESGRAKPRTTP